jgi:collagenase-like PrtC family protease
MKLSVACTFEEHLVERLAAIGCVYEVYGKLRSDCIGGGRSSYTLRSVSRRRLEATVREAHRVGIGFNYLLNAATLGGEEQTRVGQRKIRALLDYIDGIGVDSVTVAAPWLLRLVKKRHPRLKIRAGAFAVIDSPRKARAWEELGADTLCVSAIACNRDFARLAAIRQAVSCDLQLIANANCLPACAFELTHMNLLSQSSRDADRLGGFCLDYCILHCSRQRLLDPASLLRGVWIRPEDLPRYEEIGYSNFKIVERSCPADLLVKRTAAYAARRFDGNLLELVGQVAQIRKEQRAPLAVRLRLMATLLRPRFVRPASLLKLKRYAEMIIPHEFEKGRAPIYIDNRALDGFLDEILAAGCENITCGACAICTGWADRSVSIDGEYRRKALELGAELDGGMMDGSLWEVNSRKKL